LSLETPIQCQALAISMSPLISECGTSMIPPPSVHICTQCPSWRLWVTWACDDPQLATSPACVGHHCICDRLHCIRSTRLDGGFRLGEMGRRLGSIDRIVAHAYCGRTRTLYFHSYVEHQAEPGSEGGSDTASNSMSV
jgi:hypothetical protein